MTQYSIDARGDARPALTSLRLFGALLVFITHAAYLSPFANATLAHDFTFIGINGGHFWVSLFFVLIGFVLTWSTGAGYRLRDFYRRRFLRILPNHFVVFLPALGVTLLLGATIGIAPLLVNYLFLLPGWVTDQAFGAPSPNPVTWKLGVEIFFYVLFPLPFRAFLPIPHDRVWQWWVATGLLVLAVTVVVGAILPSGPPSPLFPAGTWAQHKALLFFPITRLPDVFIGMLTARLVQEKRFPKIKVGWAAAIAVAVYAFTTAFLPAYYGFSGMFAFPAALLVGAAASRDRSRPGFLESRPALWLGETTYAFYLVHLPLLSLGLFVAAKVLPGGVKMGVVPGILFMLVMMGVALVVARLLYITVERPAMLRWGRSRRPARPQPINSGSEDIAGGEPGRAAA